ncbi:MAG: hypothetical protein J6R33_04630, partial [Clostridia bacterium]|nr:hypothetical protein [Clostridia bacterium]
RAQLFLVGFAHVLLVFFFVTTLSVVDRRSASAAPYFDGQTLFHVNREGITVFGQTYLWP